MSDEDCDCADQADALGKQCWWVLCAVCGEAFLQLRVDQTICGALCKKQVVREQRQATQRAFESVTGKTRRWRRGEEGRQIDQSVRRRFQVARGIRKHHVVDWQITIEEYAGIVSQPCHYCGHALNSAGSGLDRIIPGQAYSVANVVPCCWVCNNVKSNVFTIDEMREIGAVIGRLRETWPATRSRRNTAWETMLKTT